MNIAHLLRNAALPFGDRPAVSLGREVVWSYTTFMHRVARLAGGFQAALRLEPGDRVAIAMRNAPDYLTTVWATWQAGCCVVPINAKLHPLELEYMLASSGARCCIVDDEVGASLSPASEGHAARIIGVDSEEFRRLLAAEPIAAVPREADKPAWIFYTSGTTGRPKGATLTHRNLLGMTLRYYPDAGGVDEHDCMVHGAPLSHGSGLYSLPHIAKASNQVVPASSGFDPGEIFDLLHHYPKVTTFAAPTMLNRMARHERARSAPMHHWQTVFYGGAPMYVEDLKAALDRFGPCLWQNYGQGESPCTGTALSKAIHGDRSHPNWAARLGTAGIARTGVDVRVVGEDGRELPAGETGEVVFRSDVTMEGYWNDPEATARAIRQGWLHTGDLGSLDKAGFLTLRDRSKDLIISGGSNIYPREIEEVLLCHPGVSEVSVVGRSNPEWGEEVVAFIVAFPGAHPTREELDALCLSRIARFKRPKEYRFVPSMPKSSYGKILKTELRRQFAAAPDLAGGDGQR